MILGLNDSHDAGVAIVAPDGEILFAANEERYTGRKLQWGFPSLSLERALVCTGISPADITDVAFGFRGLIEPESNSLLPMEKVGLARRLFTYAAAVGGPLVATRPASALLQASATAMRLNRHHIARELERLQIPCKPRFIRHHEAHAASAYLTSGYESACVITIDAGGDGLSGALWRGNKQGLKLLEPLPRIHSLGDFWLAITLICGFHPDRHGGKITGLAAHQPCPPALAALKTLYKTVPGKFMVRNRRYLFWKRLVAQLRQVLAPFNREEIAWGAQRLLEEMVVHLVKEGLKSTGEARLALAGGVFANVRLNMEILELAECEGMFIHPHMGDGGCALGAALAVASSSYQARPRPMLHAFLGDDAGVPSAENLEGLDATHYADLRDMAAATAELIADDLVVGVVRGRMEYGPRALTNRSILYHPFDPGVMEWLNERLDRTEFMPFAPVMEESEAPAYFGLCEKGTFPSRFMTVCLPATKLASERAPAIVHIDGTARPQFVDSATTPFTCLLLDEFKRLTGVPILINTSFNRHEQPILRTANQAVEELKRGVVDALVLEDTILRRP